MQASRKFSSIVLSVLLAGTLLSPIVSGSNEEKPLSSKNPYIDAISPGDNVPEVVNAIIEIPKGERLKYEIDKKFGILKVDRLVNASFNFPANYGFIPQTLEDDGDPLDVLIISSVSIHPLALVECRVIGVMPMVDQGAGDNKILAVIENDAEYAHFKDVEDIPAEVTKQIKDFFVNYKKSEGKVVVIEDFGNKNEAYKVIQQALKLYKTKQKEASLGGDRDSL
mgnify:CR=1 FL=1